MGAKWEIAKEWMEHHHGWHFLFRSTTSLVFLHLSFKTHFCFAKISTTSQFSVFQSSSSSIKILISMASRRRMLLKVIILGDSGYASSFSFFFLQFLLPIFSFEFNHQMSYIISLIEKWKGLLHLILKFTFLIQI